MDPSLVFLRRNKELVLNLNPRLHKIQMIFPGNHCWGSQKSKDWEKEPILNHQFFASSFMSYTFNCLKFSKNLKPELQVVELQVL
jgi:hypothetical protein